MSRELPLIELAMGTIGAAAAAALVVEYGVGVSPQLAARLHTYQLAAAWLFCVLQALKLAFVRRPGHYLSRRWLDFVLVSALAFQLLSARALEATPEFEYLLRHGAPAPLAATSLALVQAYFAAVGVLRSSLLQSLLFKLRLHPAQTVMLSFVALIAAGTAALKLPRALAAGQSLTVGEALFTAVSAACVTGLSVVDTGRTFSMTGQVILLVLMQAGGLGILTLTAFAAVLGGELLGSQARALGSIFEAQSLREVRAMVLKIVSLTLAVEALGAMLLYRELETHVADPSLRAFHAVFHSVSAFCNAGFALYPDSLARFAGDAGTMATFCALIVAGSLGYPVMSRLPATAARLLSGRWRETPDHDRVVLTATALLVAGGAGAFFVLERNGLLAGRQLSQAIWESIFIPITTRTCGFQTFDLGTLAGPSLALLLGLMMIGGAPASSAGGLKVTAAALLLSRAAATAGWRPAWHDEGAWEKARLVIAGVVAAAAASSVALILFEDGPPRRLVFEAVSAVGTVGLSMGATSELGPAGRVVAMAGMFMGRVGPACLALSWALRHPHRRPDSVMVG